MFGRQFEGRFEGRRERGFAPGKGEGRRGHRGMGKGFGKRGFGGKGRRGGRFGGMDDDDTLRAGRILAQGDLRLIVLALAEEQPRHGYDIIKALEEKTSGWYSPSPGIVYPTLTYLEEVGYLSAQPEGAKKLYSITDDGKAYLGENRALADAIMKRLAQIGERAERIRSRQESESEENRKQLPLVRAAFQNLRDETIGRLKGNPDAEAKVVEILARAANEIKKLS